MQTRTADEKLKVNVAPRAVADPITASREMIAKIAETELATWGRIQALRNEVESAGTDSLEIAADALIRGEAVVGTVEDPKLRKVREETTTYLTLLGPLRLRRLAAIRAHFAAQVSDMRASAAAKRAEVAEIDAKIQPLLEMLSELEGIRFDRGITLAQPPDNKFETAGRELLVPYARFMLSAGFPCLEPLSCRLRNEAAELDREARRVEALAVSDSGSANASSLDGLIRAVYLDPTTIGPAVESIQDWFLACAGRMQRHERNNPHLSQGAAARAFLVWRNGVIVEQESYISAHFHQFLRHDTVSVNL